MREQEDRANNDDYYDSIMKREIGTQWNMRDPPVQRHAKRALKGSGVVTTNSGNK